MENNVLYTMFVVEQTDKHVILEQILSRDGGFVKVTKKIENGVIKTLKTEEVHKYKNGFYDDLELFKMVCENLDTEYLNENGSDIFLRIKNLLRVKYRVVFEKVVDYSYEYDIVSNYQYCLIKKEYVINIEDSFYKIITSQTSDDDEVVDNIIEVIPIQELKIDFIDKGSDF